MKTSTAKIGDIATDLRSGFASGQDIDEGVVQFRMNNVDRSGRLVWDKVRRVPNDLVRADLLVQPGDILFNATNSPELVGKSALFDGLAEPVTFSNHFIRLRTRETVAYPGYVSRWLQREFERGRFFRMCRAWVNQASITKAQLAGLSIPLPPLDEQRRIAANLDKADALRQKRKRAIALLDALTQSIFLEMFGDPVLNPKGWRVCTLGDIEDFLTSGSRGWAKYYADNGQAFIRIQNLKAGILDTSDMAYVLAPDGAEKRRTTVKKDDVLISITADLGRVAVVPDNLHGAANINQHLALFRPKGINSTYLAQFLSSPAGQRQFAASDKGGVKAGLNFDDIRKITVLLPPNSEQQKFANITQTVVERMAVLTKSASESELLFSSLQHRAFTSEA